MTAPTKVYRWKLANPRAQIWLQLKKADTFLTHEQLLKALPQFTSVQISNSLYQMATAHVVLKEGAPNSRAQRFTLNPVGPVPTFDAHEEDAEPAGDAPPPTAGAALQGWLTPGVDLGPKKPLREPVAVAAPPPVTAPAPAAAPAPEPAPAPLPAAETQRITHPDMTGHKEGAWMVREGDEFVPLASLPRLQPPSLGLRTRRVGPAPEASAPGPQPRQRIMAPLPLAGETREDLPESGFLCALFSNGKLQLQVHDQVTTLSVEHTRALLHYLDHLDAGHLVDGLADVRGMSSCA